MDDWRLYVSRELNRTIPFDEDKAIAFVREKGAEEHSDKKCTLQNDGNGQLELKLDGEKVKEFYENVIMKVNEPSKRSVGPVRTSKRKNVARTTIKSPEKDMKPLSVEGMFQLVQEGNLSRLKGILMDGNHSVNTRDRFGWSLLMCAAFAGHSDVVEYLLNNAAIWVGVTDGRGFDAPTLAEYAGHIELAEKIRTFHDQEEDDVLIERTSSHDDKSDSFYCDICQMDGTGYSSHCVSTVHQFSCQHKSNLLPYTLSASNRGFQMMVRSGWDPNAGLGTDGQGRQYPIKTVLKKDRHGLGGDSLKPRVTHFKPGDVSAIRNHRWQKHASQRKECRTKKDREIALCKEKKWEINIRRYMSNDY
jgi:hypothetical protein